MRVFLPLLLVATALIGLGIVYPALNGPFRVDCGQLDEATCAQLWREAAIREEGPTGLLPVTRVRVSGTITGTDLETFCGTIYIERWIFATAINVDC